MAYRDHPPIEKTYTTKYKDLDSDLAISLYIDKLNAGGGGGDGPEAVMDGLSESIHKISWR